MEIRFAAPFRLDLDFQPDYLLNIRHKLFSRTIKKYFQINDPSFVNDGKSKWEVWKNMKFTSFQRPHSQLPRSCMIKQMDDIPEILTEAWKLFIEKFHSKLE